MRILRLLSLSLLTLSMGLASADAQNLSRNSGPAEQPPSSFKGKQYVDSRGCVYIRAGFSGRVTWVPRVTRSRQIVCGQQPSITSSARTTKAAPRVVKKAPAKAVASRIPEGAKVVKKTTTVIPAAPKKTTRVVRKAVAAPKKQVRVVRQSVAASKPQKRVVRKSVAAPKVQTRVVRKQVKSKRATVQPKVIYRCGASDFSSQFINEGARCGPQSGKSRGVVREEVSPQSSNLPKQGQLVGPKGANRKIVEARAPIPKGYKAAWSDDRLNPLRGVGTTSGKAQMQLIWSNTVPRYLIDPSTGKPATAKQRRVLGIF